MRNGAVQGGEILTPLELQHSPQRPMASEARTLFRNTEQQVFNITYDQNGTVRTLSPCYSSQTADLMSLSVKG